MKLPTFSRIGRAMACPASELLPRIERQAGAAAQAGKADHAELYDAIAHGKAASFDVEPLLAWLREDGGEIAGELALAYDPDTEESIELGNNIDRQYEAHGADMAAQFCGALDACAVARKGTDSAVRVVDLKTGRSDGDMWQLKAQAVALARFVGADVVHAAFWYIPRDGGEQSKQVFTWSTMDLDGFAEEMAQLKRDLSYPLMAVDVSSDGRSSPPRPISASVVEGSWCNYCPAYVACPAKVALARVLAAEVTAAGSVLGEEIATLTPVEAGLAWERLIKAERLLEHVRAGLEGYARNVPLELPDGKVVKPVPTTREYINGSVAYNVIARDVSLAKAGECCPPATSKTAIQKALGAGAARAVIEAIGAAGGIEVKRSETIKAVKP